MCGYTAVLPLTFYSKFFKTIVPEAVKIRLCAPKFCTNAALKYTKIHNSLNLLTSQTFLYTSYCQKLFALEPINC